MAKIRSYGEAQTSAQPKAFSSTGGARIAEMEGEANRELISSATNLAGAIYKGVAQGEISDLNASMAKAREDWTQNLNNQIRSGQVDVDKLREDYQSYMDNVSQDASTPEAMTYFERQSSRLRGTLMKSAVLGQARVAGEKAVANYTSALNSNSNTLAMNPSQFRDIYDSSVESLDAQVASGAIDFTQAEKLKRATAAELAKASIRGWADIDPNLAEQKMKSGEYSEFVDNDVLTQMQGYTNSIRTAKRLEEERAAAAADKARKLADEAWQAKNVNNLLTLSLKSEDILKSDMSPDNKIRWMKLQKDAIKESTETDPRIFNDLVKRATLPESDPNKIRSMADLAPYTGAGGISIEDATKINGFIQKLPEGENAADNRKRLIDYATAQLSKKNPMLGIADPDGERNMAAFVVALQQEEAAMRREKKNVSLLYDPTSKEYFGNRIGKYALTPQEIMAKQAGRMQNADIPPVQTSLIESPGPGGTTPPPQNEKLRKPGESAAAYLKRMKGG